MDQAKWIYTNVCRLAGCSLLSAVSLAMTLLMTSTALADIVCVKKGPYKDAEDRCRGGYSIMVDGKEGNSTWPFENAPGAEGDQYMAQVQDKIH